MKKAFTLAALLACTPAFSQSTSDGNIIFQNVNIAVSPGATTGGGNGNGTYNLPIFVGQPPLGATTPAGLLPGGMKAGLFLNNQTTPLATAVLGNTPNTAAFLAVPFSQPVTIPGSPPGSTPILTVRVWQDTTKSFGESMASGLAWGEWTFTSPPLGGTPFGGTPIQTPTMTGWGPTDGSGWTIFLIPEPSSVSLGALGAVLAWHRISRASRRLT